MAKPIIGIVAKPISKGQSMWNKLKITEEFRSLIVKNGGIPLGILPTSRVIEFQEDERKYANDSLTLEEKEDLYNVLGKCDGFILQGGWINGYYEIEIAKYAIENDIPIIGTCAGFNNLIFALGGKIKNEIHEEHNVYDKKYRHKVKINKDSKLYDIIKKEEIEVNSIHKFVAGDDDIKQYKVVAHSEDNLVEAIELKEKKFVMGLKWHPEIMTDTDPLMNDIFEEFIKACIK